MNPTHQTARARLHAVIGLAVIGVLTACGASTGASSPSQSPAATPTVTTPSASPTKPAAPVAPASLRQSDPHGYQACQLIAQFAKKSAGGNMDDTVINLGIDAGKQAALSNTPAIKASNTAQGVDPDALRTACLARGVNVPPLPDQ